METGKKDPSIRNVRGKPGFINCCLSWCWRWGDAVSSHSTLTPLLLNHKENTMEAVFLDLPS